jgi:hypothetical protein
MGERIVAQDLYNSPTAGGGGGGGGGGLASSSSSSSSFIGAGARKVSNVGLSLPETATSGHDDGDAYPTSVADAFATKPMEAIRWFYALLYPRKYVFEEKDVGAKYRSEWGELVRTYNDMSASLSTRLLVACLQASSAFARTFKQQKGLSMLHQCLPFHRKIDSVLYSLVSLFLDYNVLRFPVTAAFDLETVKRCFSFAQGPTFLAETFWHTLLSSSSSSSTVGQGTVSNPDATLLDNHFGGNITECEEIPHHAIFNLITLLMKCNDSDSDPDHSVDDGTAGTAPGVDPGKASPSKNTNLVISKVVLCDCRERTGKRTCRLCVSNECSCLVFPKLLLFAFLCGISSVLPFFLSSFLSSFLPCFLSFSRRSTFLPSFVLFLLSLSLSLSPKVLSTTS